MTSAFDKWAEGLRLVCEPKPLPTTTTTLGEIVGWKVWRVARGIDHPYLQSPLCGDEWPTDSPLHADYDRWIPIPAHIRNPGIHA